MSEREDIEIKNMIGAQEDTPADASSEAATPEKPVLPPHKEYAKRLLQFNSFYIQLLCCIGVIVAVGITLAVIYSVLLGVVICVAGACLYGYLALDEMSKKLGIRYSSGEGGVTAVSCCARYGDVMWIPQRLIWFDVIKIGDKAFASEKNIELKRVFLPKTLKEIGTDVFEGCGALCEIYFEGTEKEWNEIIKKTDFSHCKVIFDAKYPPIPKKKKKKKIKEGANDVRSK